MEAKMDREYSEIQELVRQRADFQARLKLLPYDGTPEIKARGEGKYLYVRKRVAGKLTSAYVGAFDDELYAALLRWSKEARELKKRIRGVAKRLAELGHETTELSAAVLLNVEFARANMKSCIYDQAVLEGVATTFPQTEDILENGRVNGVSANDVQKILNLKHAWEFVADPDVVAAKPDYSVLRHVARLVNEGFYADGGRIRGVPVAIGGTTYKPPLPVEADVRGRIAQILSEGGEPVDVAIRLCLYCMKTQIFNDGNKRAAVIFANHYLIGRAGGLLVIPERNVSEFKRLLVRHYEGRDEGKIAAFLKKKCWRRLG